MSNPKTAYRSALTDLDNLSRQQSTATAKQREFAERRRLLEERRGVATKNHQALRMQSIRGTAVTREVDAANEEVAAIAAGLFELDADERAARDALSALDGEINKAKNTLDKALTACCMADAAEKEMALRNDKKLRRMLSEILAAYVASTDPRLGSPIGSRTNWEGILLGIFPEPEGDEFQAVYDAYFECLQNDN